MNLLQQIKHWAGLGLDIDVELARIYLPPGSKLVYHVTLTSEETMRVRALQAEVVKGMAIPGSNDWGADPAFCAADTVRGIEVKPDAPYSMTGAIQLPPDLPYTVQEGVNATHWSLRVTADIAGGRDPSTIVGFVVGPAASFPWQTDQPIRISRADQTYTVTARGEYTIVQVDKNNTDTIQASISLLISVALGDLLAEQPELLTNREQPHYFRDLSGALHELTTPRVRAAAFIPVDSLLALSVKEIQVEVV